MTVFTTIAFAAFLLKYNHFVAFYQGCGDFADYFCTFDIRCANFNISIIVGEENGVELDSVAFFYIFAEEMNIKELAGFGLKLLSFNINNSVH